MSFPRSWKLLGQSQTLIEHRQRLAGQAEPLQPMVRTISDKYARSLFTPIKPDSVRLLELALLSARASPRADVLRLRVVMMDPGFAISVCHVEIAIRRDGHTRRAKLIGLVYSVGIRQDIP